MIAEMTDTELIAFDASFHNPVTPAWATGWIIPSRRRPGSHRRIQKRAAPTPEAAQKIAVAVAVVAAALSVSVERMMSTSKHGRNAYARQVAMYVAREGLRIGFAQIGLYFHRDHSTVIYATQKVAARIVENVEQRRLVEGLIAEARA